MMIISIEIVQEITFLNVKFTLFIINIAKIILDNANILLILMSFPSKYYEQFLEINQIVSRLKGVSR